MKRLAMLIVLLAAVSAHAAIYKNKGSQKLPVFAVDATGAAKTGDAANITAQISKDGGACASSNDANPAELDATNAPGVYLFDMTQAETNADLIVLTAKSTTSGVIIRPMILFTEPEIRTANTTQIEGGDATDAITAAADAATPENVGLADGAITAAKIAGNALTAAKFDPDVSAEFLVAFEANGTKLDHLWEMTEDDGGTRRFTTHALEQAPAGTGGGASVEDFIASLSDGTATLWIKSLEIRNPDDVALSINGLNHGMEIYGKNGASAVYFMMNSDAPGMATDGGGGYSGELGPAVGGAVGPGGTSKTLTVRTTGGVPIADAAVWVTTDAAGTNTIAGTLRTNASGQVEFMLETGTYYWWGRKTGVNFSNPHTFTVP